VERVMGVTYEVRKQIACFIIDNGKMDVITPRIHKDFYRKQR
jgi:hypothetical protein